METTTVDFVRNRSKTNSVKTNEIPVEHACNEFQEVLKTDTFQTNERPSSMSPIISTEDLNGIYQSADLLNKVGNDSKENSKNKHSLTSSSSSSPSPTVNYCNGDKAESPVIIGTLSLAEGLLLNSEKAITITLQSPSPSATDLMLLLKLAIMGIIFQYAASYLLSFLPIEEGSSSSFILMQLLLFPAGIFIGFTRIFKSCNGKSELKTTESIRWEVAVPSIIDDGTWLSPVFTTRTPKSFLGYSIPGGWGGFHLCNWALLLKRKDGHKSRLQFGLKALDLNSVCKLGLNVSMRVNENELSIGYHPFKSSGDVAYTGPTTISEDKLDITCNLQCLYFHPNKQP